MNSSAQTAVTTISWLDASQAFFRSRWPRYCDAITAPPVATAAKTALMSMLIMSTSDTPEIAASPTEEIIIVSAMPTVRAST